MSTDPSQRRWHLVIHALVAVIATAPLAWRIHDRLPLGQERSATVAYFNLWSLRWTSSQLPWHWATWWDAPIFFPSRGTYANSELQVATAAVFRMLSFMANDTTAYGLIVLGALSLNGIAANRLARRLGASRWPALFTGVLAQLLPFVFHELGVLQLIMLWPVIFAIDRLLAWCERPRVRDGALLGLWLAIASLTCGYHALLFVTTAALAAPLVIKASWWEQRRQRILGIAAAITVDTSIALPFQLAQQRRLGTIRWTDATIRSGSATWHSLGPSGSHWPGAVLLALALCGLVIGRHRREVRFLGAMAIIATLLALGTRLSVLGWRPYGSLVDHVLAFARMRSPFRSTAIVQIALVALASVSLESLWQRRSLVRLAMVGLVVVSLVGRDLGPGELVTLPETDTPWIDWLRAHPGGPIVSLPAADGSNVEAFEPTTAAMLQGLEHGHALVNGYSGFFPADHRSLRNDLASFPDARSVNELRTLGVRYAVADLAWWTARRDTDARALGLTIISSGPAGVLIEL
ncbi:MAG: hypothetical protein AB7V43_09880 [Acidimicrobiia bacterium]